MDYIQKQIRGLYLSSVLGSLSLTGAWVAILAARGYSLVEIGFAETVFHLASILFEIPSGILADLYGRKRMLLVSSAARMMGNFVMIFSRNFSIICLSMVFNAMSYNFSSGSGDALAYDSLKSARRESYFEKYASNQLIIYRLCGGLSPWREFSSPAERAIPYPCSKRGLSHRREAAPSNFLILRCDTIL